MYGTVAHLKVKPGAIDSLNRMENRKPEGYVASYVFRLDQNPDEVILVAIFEDERSYRANADSPEQDREYRDLRSHLSADPEWHDGEIVFADVRECTTC
jgi:hypothetical protein